MEKEEEKSSNPDSTSSGGWGSWGWNLVSQTVNTVQSNISTVTDNYVKPTLGTVQQVTTQMGMSRTREISEHWRFIEID